MIVPACQSVFDELGVGYSEAVYHTAVETQLRLDGVAYESEVVIPVRYRGHTVGSVRADLIIDGVVVELKALTRATKLDAAVRQARMYCRLLGLTRGLVVNFCQDTGLLGVESVVV